MTQVRGKEGNEGREDEVIVNFRTELINFDTIIYIYIYQYYTVDYTYLLPGIIVYCLHISTYIYIYQYIQEKHMDEPHESQRDHGELCVLNFCSNKNLCPQNYIYVCLSY